LIDRMIRPLIILGAFFCFRALALGQVEIVTSDGRLSYDFNRPNQFIPIDATPGSPVKIAWVHQRPNFDYEIKYSIQTAPNSWESHPITISSNDRANIWSGKDGRTFIYVDYGLQYFDNGDSLELRYGDTFDVMDSLGCFQFIFRDFDGSHFIFSSDTLTNWRYGDTLSSSLRQIGVAISPDRGIAAAAFVDYNILRKYLAVAGYPLGTLNPVISVFEYTADDYTIDNNGMLYIAYSVLGDTSWKERYIWSERHGYRYMHSLRDSEINGPQVQFAFAPSRNLVFLLESSVYADYDSMNISYSSDAGDTWNFSNIHPVGGNGSTPRLAFDTLYIAGQLTDGNDVIFQKLAIDDIIFNSSGIEDWAPLPQLKLLQNYPNPFNSSTTISFETPPNTRANLAVYDLTGRKIAALFDGISRGHKSVVWNTDESGGLGLSSGIYLCRLISDNGSITQKMIFLK
jgi:hypothetical protein